MDPDASAATRQSWLVMGSMLIGQAPLVCLK